MHPTLRYALGTLVLLYSAGAQAAHAQSIPSPYNFLDRKQEVGVYLGYMSANAGRFGYGPKGGPVIGTRWAIELAGPLSFEAVAGVVDAERDIVDPGRDEGDRIIGVGDALISTIDVRLRFSFPGARTWHGISPFILAGGGLGFDLSGAAPDDTDLLPADRFDFGTSFFGTLGGGTRIFLSDAFAIRADGFFSLWQIDTPPGYSDPNRSFETVEESEWVNGFTFTLSGLWRW